MAVTQFPLQRLPLPSAAVEVSGWGPGAAFFVENTMAEQTSDGQKVSLYHPLNSGALVFVRSTGLIAENRPPDILLAVRVGPPDARGKREVLLARMGPQGE
jgi:hypothetical protein